jgi:hypothetical protein
MNGKPVPKEEYDNTLYRTIYLGENRLKEEFSGNAFD